MLKNNWCSDHFGAVFIAGTMHFYHKPTIQHTKLLQLAIAKRITMQGPCGVADIELTILQSQASIL